jgi:peptide/nickel transport system permease protein
MSSNPDLPHGQTAAEELYDIDDVSVAPLVPNEDDVQSIYVAPNWKLVWWRFRKHKLAVVCTVIVIIIAIVAIMPSFFSTQ